MQRLSFATLRAAAAMVISFSLAACGGGGGSSSGNATGTAAAGTAASSAATSTMTPTADGKLHAACASCGAADDLTYTGSGIGIWQALNGSSQTDAVDVSLSNVSGRTVTLVFTNEGGTQTISPVTTSQDFTQATSKKMARQSFLDPENLSEETQLDTIHEFNRKGWSALTHRDTAPVADSTAKVLQRVVAAQNVVGSTTRNFWLVDDIQRATTLQGSQQTSDGTVVNVWVENSEYGAQKMTATIVQQLLDAYTRAGGVYDIVKSIGGPFWGATPYTNMIAANGQPIDIVVVNLNPDGKAYGELGYYYSLNNFVNQGSGATQYSNQGLSLYLDSETLYLGGALGMKAMKTVMAHESEHMQSFYRRGMLMGTDYEFDTWLEEMMAMMMEDWASYNLDSTYDSVRDDRFLAFLTYNGHGSYGCGLDSWDPEDTSCDGYSTNGAFGGFLNRQLGLDFYKALLANKSSTDSMEVLNNVINRFRTGSSAAIELRHFAAAAESQIPLSANIPRYSLPSRQDGGFTLSAIDPSTVKRYLPANSPSPMLRLSSFPAVRSNVPATYKETVMLPPNATLTVVVQ